MALERLTVPRAVLSRCERAVEDEGGDVGVRVDEPVWIPPCVAVAAAEMTAVGRNDVAAL